MGCKVGIGSTPDIVYLDIHVFTDNKNNVETKYNVSLLDQILSVFSVWFEIIKTWNESDLLEIETEKDFLV